MLSDARTRFEHERALDGAGVAVGGAAVGDDVVGVGDAEALALGDTLGLAVEGGVDAVGWGLLVGAEVAHPTSRIGRRTTAR